MYTCMLKQLHSQVTVVFHSSFLTGASIENKNMHSCAQTNLHIEPVLENSNTNVYSSNKFQIAEIQNHESCVQYDK